MADIQSQTLARLPTGQASKVTLVFDKDNWNLSAKRVLGRKEVERRFFRCKSETGTKWFECGPALANSITEQVDRFIADARVDVKKLRELDIVVSRRGQGCYSAAVASKPSEVPRISVWIRLADWLKSVWCGSGK